MVLWFGVSSLAWSAPAKKQSQPITAKPDAPENIMKLMSSSFLVLGFCATPLPFVARLSLPTEIMLCPARITLQKLREIAKTESNQFLLCKMQIHNDNHFWRLWSIRQDIPMSKTGAKYRSYFEWWLDNWWSFRNPDRKSESVEIIWIDSLVNHQILRELFAYKNYWNCFEVIFLLLFNCRCHKTPEETMTHDVIFQLPIAQGCLVIGSFESGLQGNPIWWLQIWNCSQSSG